MGISSVLNRLSTCLASETSIFLIEGPDSRSLKFLPFDPYNHVAAYVLDRANDLKPEKYHSRDLLTPQESDGGNVTRLGFNRKTGPVERGMAPFAHNIHHALDVVPLQDMILQLRLEGVEGTSRKYIVMDIQGRHPGIKFDHLGREGKEGYLPFEIPGLTINMDIFEGKTYPRDVAVGKLRQIETALQEIYSVKRTPSIIAGYCGPSPKGIGEDNVVVLQV